MRWGDIKQGAGGKRGLMAVLTVLTILGCQVGGFLVIFDLLYIPPLQGRDNLTELLFWFLASICGIN